jgi:hypothetical protein
MGASTTGTSGITRVVAGAEAGGKGLSNLEAAAEVGKMLGGAGLAVGAVAAPVAGAALAYRAATERPGENDSGGIAGKGVPSKAEEQAQVHLNEERFRKAEQEQH